MVQRRAPRESFTQRVLAELAPHVPPLRCCRAAMLQGMLAVSEDRTVITTTRLVAARAAMQVLHAERQPAHLVRIAAARRNRYGLWGADLTKLPASTDAPHCRRAWLRGAVMGAGRISRPDAAAHLEIACPDADAAAQLQTTLTGFGIPASIRQRRG